MMSHMSEKIFGAILSYVVLYLFLVTFANTFTMVAPSSWFMEYQGIEPRTAAFEYGEEMRFTSHITRKTDKPLDIRWNDVVRCDFGDGYETWRHAEVSVENSPLQSQSIDAPERFVNTPYDAPWAFPHPAPQERAACILSSTYKVCNNYGCYKPEYIESSIFFVVEERTPRSN